MKIKDFQTESWSQKYKNSINCSHPKGFSQRAHCAGKNKQNESVEMEMVCEDCGMCKSHGSLNEIRKGQKDSNGYTRCWPGKHAEGTKKGRNGGQVRNCMPNESIQESKQRCKQCGMTDCSCKPGTCKCKPIKGWIPNKGFRKAVAEQQLNEFAPLLAAGARLFMAAAPKIAQVAGKAGQAGARGVGQAARAGTEIAAKNAGQIGIGAGAYEIGSSVADIAKDIAAKVGTALDEKTVLDLAALAFKYAIPAGIVLAILYGGKKAIDSLFADPKTQQAMAEALRPIPVDDQGNRIVGMPPVEPWGKVGDPGSGKSSPKGVVTYTPTGLIHRSNHGDVTPRPQAVPEDFNGEYDDEAGMAQGNLYTIAQAAQGLLDTIDDRDNLPEWAQEKIAKVEGMLVSVWNYLQSQKAQGIDPEINEMYEAMDQLAEEMAAKKGISADLVWESFEALDDNMLYETAAWRRKEGKSKKGGLNAKGVASYRRENPGSKLQTAVTTKPSKLKPGSKAAKRRKSFCARMSGVKGPAKKPNGEPTRKTLALRKWNC